MSNIYQLALQNRNLSFIDDETGKVFLLSNKEFFYSSNSEKKLVFAYLDNSIKSVINFWHLLNSNHTIALLSPLLSSNLKNKLELHYKPNWIFDNTRNIISEYELVENEGYKFFQQCKTTIYSIHPSIKILLSTSGTTGSPKFVKLSEENLISNAHSICEYLPINGSDVTPLNLPIYYSYGLSILTSNALKGGKIVCTNDDLLKKSFWESFAKYEFTSFAGVPFIFEMLDRIGFTKKDYPTLKYFTQAGGKLQDHLVKKFAEYALEKDVNFYVMYGQTEATARMSYLDTRESLNKLGSIGRPIPGGKFSIDPVNNELCYLGPNVFGGYVERIADLESFHKISVLRTGDIGHVDDEGFFYINGRLKRFVKLFGSRINLDEIEKIIANEFQVNAKCVGINDKVIVVYVTEDLNYKDSLISYICLNLKIHISAIKLKVIDYFPLTNNGKIDYSKLITWYESN